VEVKVVEAVDIRPLLNSTVVEVACSPVPRVLNGKAKLRAAGQDVRQSPVRQIVPEANVVEVALVVVLFDAVKDWNVDEPITNKSPAPFMVVVAVAPKEA
jgi:ribosomal protein L12E/L44/L45/RPP1/RPP2